MRSAAALCLLLAACQQLDTTASRGLQGTGPTAPASVDPDAGAGPGDDACEPVRAQARTIRQTHCAPCHQAPAKEGSFYFVLDDATLVKAVSSTGQPFIVPGAPDGSRLFRRVAAGEMPPRSISRRPTADEIDALRSWIATCLTSATDAPPDALPPVTPDAGAAPDPADGCGKPGQLCCGANACEGGACCVLGQCRANGDACGGAAIAGIPDGLPGMCVDGTCRDGAQSCGGVAQPCCGASGSCTAAHAGCGMDAVCQACGESGQPCCQNGGAATCAAGLGCSFTGFGRAGMCEPCGGEGQSCCGSGLAAQKTCDGGLTCHYVAGMGDHCAK